MIIEYCEDGIAVSDFEVVDFVQKSWTEKKDIKTSNEIVITAIRSLVKAKVIPHTDITIMFKHYRIEIDSRGHLNHYPPGFCETYFKLLVSLV